jgi:glycosyltransferase involved in cell wall biosynthesis
LEARFGALTATDHLGRGVGERLSGVRRVCFVAGIDGAPLRYRVHLPMEALATVGVAATCHFYRDPDVVTAALGADAVVLYRVPATVEVLELVDRLRDKGIPVVFDVDDLIFDPGLEGSIPALQILPPDEASLWLEGVHRYRTTLEACDAFIGSTATLVDQAAALIPGLATFTFANGVSRVLARVGDAARRSDRRDGPLRIGYFSGTTTHDRDWAMVAPAVAEVLRAHPQVELWLGGWVPEVPPLAPFEPRIRRLGFVDWRAVVRLQRDLDVNLAPLEPDNPFNEAKSAIKWLEAALAGTPTVASPTAPFRDAIDDGRTGVLAAATDAWVDALDALLGDQVRRDAMGAAARRAALLRWSPAQQGRRYAAILDEIAAAHAGSGGTRASAWSPVAPSEPSFPVPHPLESYEQVDAVGDRLRRWRSSTEGRFAWGRVRARALGQRARELLAEEGPVGLVKGAARRARRRL